VRSSNSSSPIPFSPALEAAVVPGVATLVDAARRAVA